MGYYLTDGLQYRIVNQMAAIGCNDTDPTQSSFDLNLLRDISIASIKLRAFASMPRCTYGTWEDSSDRKQVRVQQGRAHW